MDLEHEWENMSQVKQNGASIESSHKKAGITLSVVSHGQMNLVKELFKTIDASGAGGYLKQVILTLNTIESCSVTLKSAPVHIIKNTKPIGFSKNHNNAFKFCDSEFFCVINPDIRLEENPFLELLNAIESKDVAVVAPFVYSPQNHLEDSIRYFPSISTLIARPLKIFEGRFPIRSDIQPYNIEWAAGMFMLFKTQDYRTVGGFDERFFLYYEDVDICIRIWKLEKRVVAVPTSKVIHDAQRASHKKLQYFYWHVSSLVHYFFKHWFRFPEIKNFHD